MKRRTTEVPSLSPKKVWTESGDSTDSGLGKREKLNLSPPDTTPTDPPVNIISSPVPHNKLVGGGGGRRLSDIQCGYVGGGGSLSDKTTT